MVATNGRGGLAHPVRLTAGIAARRDLVQALGRAALDEHAEWILMHRERPLEQSRV